eukprot:CAMPEP_0114114084 /NCGR_PEP_ID=MMETSP0043_2-20121206/3251_1 /TAXON_ID=464988 /ORGANISM="Hemiselmis andersenii, Strain CCMP644" /LENGTH=328 /DNA_ID=CAMNT_0001206265 /DNA_START=298 /DNA_END=1288 /DNA_ORIENTATION=-
MLDVFAVAWIGGLLISVAPRSLLVLELSGGELSAKELFVGALESSLGLWAPRRVPPPCAALEGVEGPTLRDESADMASTVRCDELLPTLRCDTVKDFCELERSMESPKVLPEPPDSNRPLGGCLRWAHQAYGGVVGGGGPNDGTLEEEMVDKEERTHEPGLGSLGYTRGELKPQHLCVGWCVLAEETAPHDCDIAELGVPEMHPGGVDVEGLPWQEPSCERGLTNMPFTHVGCASTYSRESSRRFTSKVGTQTQHLSLTCPKRKPSASLATSRWWQHGLHGITGSAASLWKLTVTGPAESLSPHITSISNGRWAPRQTLAGHEVCSLA